MTEAGATYDPVKEMIAIQMAALEESIVRFPKQPSGEKPRTPRQLLFHLQCSILRPGDYLPSQFSFCALHGSDYPALATLYDMADWLAAHDQKRAEFVEWRRKTGRMAPAKKSNQDAAS